MKNILPVFLFVLLVCSCSNSSIENRSNQLISVENSKSIIPEGIAVDPISGKIYLSSLHQEKIIAVDEEGRNKDLISTNEHGFQSGIGMTVQNGKLYAASSSLNPEAGETYVFVLNPESGDLINKYQLVDTNIHLFNDLAVTKEGRIFVTDTYSNAVYSIDPGVKKPQLFLRSEEIKWPNGIALSAEEDILYVASTTNGIRAIDPKTAAILSPVDTLSTGLDGLQLYKNSLVGIQNGNRPVHRVLRFYLDESGKKITDHEVLLEEHPEFDVPTTLDIHNDKMYILANSQLRNLNQQENKIRDTSILKNVVIIIKNL